MKDGTRIVRLVGEVKFDGLYWEHLWLLDYSGTPVSIVYEDYERTTIRIANEHGGCSITHQDKSYVIPDEALAAQPGGADRG